MSDFTGFLDLNNSILNKKEVLESMTKTFNNTQISFLNNFYIDKSIALFSTNKNTKKNKNNRTIERNQPYMEYYSSNSYLIVFDGFLYNSNTLKNILLENDFSFISNSDIELVLKAYIYFGEKLVNYLEGSFSFVIFDKSKKSLFLCRDHLGSRPLYYSIFNNIFIFSSSIKSILNFPNLSPIVSSKELSELIGFGPYHTPGITYFKNILELKPAHFAWFNNLGLSTKNYWKLSYEPHTDNFSKTCSNIRELLSQSITNNINNENDISSFLLGDLNSSIISKHISDYCQIKNMKKFNTYSVSILPKENIRLISLMNKVLYSNPKNIITSNNSLSSFYTNLLICDSPIVTDFSTFLLPIYKFIKKERSLIFSGIGANEIFSSTCLSYNDDILGISLLPQKLQKKLYLNDYIQKQKLNILSEINLDTYSSPSLLAIQKSNYLNLIYSLQYKLTLYSKLSKYYNLEIRSPFCNHKLLQYVWNIPLDWKFFNGHNKGILKYSYRNFLPSEIIDQNDFIPINTLSSDYIKNLKFLVYKILNNHNSPIYEFFNIDYILSLLNNYTFDFKNINTKKSKSIVKLLEYICQINIWIEKYNIKLDL